jgi:16S rRNA (adenine1518-N6/adenine1519-N6)-dimethyltransferase
VSRAKKSLGQNFLVDPSVIGRIVDATGVRDGEHVVEIGPGRGALTGSLAARAGRLTLVEKDDELAPALAAKFGPAVSVWHGDALAVMPEHLELSEPVRVVANLPYNVGARITMHLLEEWPGWVKSMTLMFQREVADRITASPGTKPYGGLTVLVQSMAEAWMLFGVPPGAFRPVPKVQSAVVRITPRAVPLWEGLDYERFRRVVRAGFAARRKTVLNSLGGGTGLGVSADVLRPALDAAGIDPATRADAVPVDRWVALVSALPDSGVRS